jgi:branched-chain amino acid transport system permease protein
VVDGALSGAVYALVALAFVVVYRASRMINFALGEWLMLGAGLTATGVHVLGLGLAGGMVFATLGMGALGLAFNRVVLRPMMGRPVIALIMVTLGLGALLRAVATLALTGVPRRLPLPIPAEPLRLGELAISSERLAAGIVSAVAVVLIAVLAHRSRMGLAMRAIADDHQVAMAMGIDPHRYFAIAWLGVGLIAVLAGTLWTAVAGGGFGVVLVGLKIFPIVIIGGLDSIAGTLVGALLIGVLESLAAGYLDPWLGGGFSTTACYLVLIAMLCVRPYGLFGRADATRV